MKVKSESEVAQSCLTLSNPVDCRQEYWSGVPLPSPLDLIDGQILESSVMPTVVLEKTLESPLDSKKIKPVNPKGNQP